MTHFTDCTVKEEFREELHEISELFYDEESAKARRRAKDLGWEEIGGGKGRSVWRVTHDHQEGPRDSATHEAPCVVKIATPAIPHHHSGRVQNNEEINQFERFPDAITEGDPPVVVPLKDWDEDRKSWVSMPEVDAGWGDTRRAQDRLAEHFWECEDLHPDNVGEMHSDSVVLDYGLECGEIKSAREFATEIGSKLKRKDGQVLGVASDDDQFATVELVTPEWYGNVDAQPSPSNIRVERGRGMVGGTFRFGPWTEARHDMIEEAAEMVMDRISGGFREVIPKPPIIDTTEDGIEMVLDIGIQVDPHDEWDEYMVENFYDRMIEAVEKHVGDAHDPLVFIEEIEAEITGQRPQEGLDIRIEDRRREGNGAILSFSHPDPSPGAPGVPPQNSRITVNGGFRELRATFGQWLHDDPISDLLPRASRRIIRELADEWDDLDLAWERDGGEVSIIVSPADTADVDMDATDIAAVYADVFDAAVDHFPTASGPDDPTQAGIDEFLDRQINAALSAVGLADGGQEYAAICPTGDRCQTQAEALAADLYDHVYGDISVDAERVNSDIADMIRRNFTPPNDEQVRVRETKTGTEVAIVTKDETLTTWDFWNDVVAAAARASADKDTFIMEVSQAILDMAEDAIAEADRVAG